MADQQQQQQQQVAKPNCILSIDIEADGESPVLSSCIEIGIVVAEEATRKVIDRISCMMKPAEGHRYSERCKREFWDRTPENIAHWNEIQEKGTTPQHAMLVLSKWLEGVKNYAGKCTWVARPASWDWMWFYSWYHAFGPKDKTPLSHSITCITTLRNQLDLMGTVSPTTLAAQFASIPKQMTHKAIDDAEHQLGMYFIIRDHYDVIRQNIRKEFYLS